MNGSTHIADLCITGPFRVFAENLDSYIYSYLDQDAPGDIPPDIAVLPVYSMRVVAGVTYIDTEV